MGQLQFFTGVCPVHVQVRTWMCNEVFAEKRAYLVCVCVTCTHITWVFVFSQWLAFRPGPGTRNRWTFSAKVGGVFQRLSLLLLQVDPGTLCTPSK